MHFVPSGTHSGATKMKKNRWHGVNPDIWLRKNNKDKHEKAKTAWLQTQSGQTRLYRIKCDLNWINMMLATHFILHSRAFNRIAILWKHVLYSVQPSDSPTDRLATRMLALTRKRGGSETRQTHTHTHTNTHTHKGDKLWEHPIIKNLCACPLLELKTFVLELSCFILGTGSCCKALGACTTYAYCSLQSTRRLYDTCILHFGSSLKSS